MKPDESGRCPYCGSEDVDYYEDGTAECYECDCRWRY